MAIIDVEPLEKKDIIDYLKYALKKKEEEPDSGKNQFTTKYYDIERIKTLIDKLNYGKSKDYIVQKTSYKETFTNSENKYYNSEKAKQEYQQRKREKITINY